MTAERLGTWALAAAAIAVGALAWWLQMRPALAVDASPLARLPGTLGDWRSVELPLESAVESILRADANVQRAYSDPKISRDPIWLYIGYYGTERGGRPEHVPRGCFTGAGWDIASAQVIDAGDRSQRRVNEYRVERDGEAQLVHFWYRSARSTGMIGGVDQRLDQILGRIQTGRADGALIRVSAILDGSPESEVRERLLEFGSELDRQVAQYWPIESPR
jgi:EpsI family protein